MAANPETTPGGERGYEAAKALARSKRISKDTTRKIQIVRPELELSAEDLEVYKSAAWVVLNRPETEWDVYDRDIVEGLAWQVEVVFRQVRVSSIQDYKNRLRAESPKDFYEEMERVAFGAMLLNFDEDSLKAWKLLYAKEKKGLIFDEGKLCRNLYSFARGKHMPEEEVMARAECVALEMPQEVCEQVAKDVFVALGSVNRADN